MQYTLETIDATIKALQTQYQVIIQPRASKEAPTLKQMRHIREAILHIDKILQDYRDMLHEQKILSGAIEKLKRAHELAYVDCSIQDLIKDAFDTLIAIQDYRELAKDNGRTEIEVVSHLLTKIDNGANWSETAISELCQELYAVIDKHKKLNNETRN